MFNTHVVFFIVTDCLRAFLNVTCPFGNGKHGVETGEKGTGASYEAATCANQSCAFHLIFFSLFRIINTKSKFEVYSTTLC